MNNVYKKIINHYGETNQKRMLQEECAELIQAISKDLRGKDHNVEEEIADLIIMLNQMILIYDKHSINEWIDYKLKVIEYKMKEGVN